MINVTVRSATEADALSLAPRLRAADRREIEAAGREPEETLLAGVRSSDPTYVAVDDNNVPHIIFGTAPSEHPILGFVWMMATPAIRKCWVRLLRETPMWIDRMSDQYQILGNLVHTENSVHIRWLKWAGFVFLRKVDIGGHSFYEFARLTKTGE